ncbi:hypothetical protein GYMLUDRAFT_38491 [Collybiopsis luxurians FD-317 M1]|nr:hypothetical protein GYMLUDRAFT_38491 [Collybiopsis luxurians FD-317 M1]
MAMDGNTDSEMYLPILESLQCLQGTIVTKIESSNISSIYRKPVKKLSNDIKDILDIVLYEHDITPEQQRKVMLDQLENRLQEFSRTLERYNQLIDVLQRRGKCMERLMRVWDLRRTKELQAEVKTRGADLERRLTRLKIRQPEDDGQFTKIGIKILEEDQEQRPSSRNSNVPSSITPRSSRTNITSAMNPITTLADAKATIRGGDFNTVGGNQYRSMVSVCNSENAVIHIHYHG